MLPVAAAAAAVEIGKSVLGGNSGSSNSGAEKERQAHLTQEFQRLERERLGLEASRERQDLLNRFKEENERFERQLKQNGELLKSSELEKVRLATELEASRQKQAQAVLDHERALSRERSDLEKLRMEKETITKEMETKLKEASLQSARDKEEYTQRAEKEKGELQNKIAFLQKKCDELLLLVDNDMKRLIVTQIQQMEKERQRQELTSLAKIDDMRLGVAEERATDLEEDLASTEADRRKVCNIVSYMSQLGLIGSRFIRSTDFDSEAVKTSLQNVVRQLKRLEMEKDKATTDARTLASKLRQKENECSSDRAKTRRTSLIRKDCDDQLVASKEALSQSEREQERLKENLSHLELDHECVKETLVETQESLSKSKSSETRLGGEIQQVRWELDEAVSDLAEAKAARCALEIENQRLRQLVRDMEFKSKSLWLRSEALHRQVQDFENNAELAGSNLRSALSRIVEEEDAHKRKLQTFISNMSESNHLTVKSLQGRLWQTQQMLTHAKSLPLQKELDVARQAMIDADKLND